MLQRKTNPHRYNIVYVNCQKKINNFVMQEQYQITITGQLIKPSLGSNFLTAKQQKQHLRQAFYVQELLFHDL